MLSSFMKIILCLLACLLVWVYGIVWFVGQIPQTPANASAEVIVVLTGGKGRLEYGLELLAEGRSDSLFVSGAGKGVSREDILLHAAPEIRGGVRALPDESIVWGSGAENTIGNAEETGRWLKEHRFQSVLLVTSSYHMPRAQEEFAQRLPEIAIIPAPVFPDDFKLDGWWWRDNERSLILSEYHKWLAGRLRHWFLTFSSSTKEE